jgi:hypothetical protein
MADNKKLPLQGQTYRTYLKLYQQYVQPHLEFSSTAWAPWQAGDKAVLEKVQEKALKQTVGLEGYL